MRFQDNSTDIFDKIIIEVLETKSFCMNCDEFFPRIVFEELKITRINRVEGMINVLKLLNNNNMSEEELIISNTILGSIVECYLMFFYTIFYDNYKKDIEIIELKELKKEGKCYNYRYRKIPKKKLNSPLRKPSEITLDILKVFSKSRLFNDFDSESKWSKWIEDIQYKRNSIHIFKDRNIGTQKEINQNIKVLLKFIIYINNHLPDVQ